MSVGEILNSGSAVGLDVFFLFWVVMIGVFSGVLSDPEEPIIHDV